MCMACTYSRCEGTSVDLELELLLVHELGLVWQDDEGVLPAGVALAPHRRCITGPGNHGTPVSWLACHRPDCVTCLALHADICGLVLHGQATQLLILDESRNHGCQHLVGCSIASSTKILVPLQMYCGWHIAAIQVASKAVQMILKLRCSIKECQNSTTSQQQAVRVTICSSN